MQGAATLAAMVDEELFKEEIVDAKSKLGSGDKTLSKYLDDTVNQAIHNSTDLEDLQDLFDDNHDIYIRKYRTIC